MDDGWGGSHGVGRAATTPPWRAAWMDGCLISQPPPCGGGDISQPPIQSALQGGVAIIHPSISQYITYIYTHSVLIHSQHPMGISLKSKQKASIQSTNKQHQYIYILMLALYVYE